MRENMCAHGIDNISHHDKPRRGRDAYDAQTQLHA